MHKNFSEIATHEKRLCSKAVVLKNTFFPWALLCLVAGNSFFRVQSMDTIFFTGALAAMNCVYTMYLTDISI